MLASKSKNRLMPEEGIACTCLEILPRCVTPSVIVLQPRSRTPSRAPSCEMCAHIALNWRHSTTRPSQAPDDRPFDPIRLLGTGPDVERRHVVDEHHHAVGEADAKAQALFLVPLRDDLGDVEAHTPSLHPERPFGIRGPGVAASSDAERTEPRLFVLIHYG